VRHIRSEGRPKGRKLLLLIKLACWAFPEKSSELVRQSRLDIVGLDSVLTDAPIGCEAKTNCATTPQSLAKIFVVTSVFWFLAGDWV